jgi:hypothetical protein
MTDTLVLDIPTTAGQAAATIASLTGDDFAPQPAKRQLGTRPLETAKVLSPTVEVPDSFNIDDWLDRTILDPFAIDWEAMAPETPETAPVAPIATAPRRLSRDQRRRADLDDRLQAMRSQMAEVRLKVAMYSADPGLR